MKQIPNLFTLLNLVFGCLAILFILDGDKNTPFDRINELSMGLIIGSFFLLLSAIVDFLDGFVARLFKASSAMGEQLDSLADAVSFGVAPGMILYRLLEVGYDLQGNTDPSFWLLAPALLFPCAAVWRLAKFNLDKEQHYYFKGIPTPAAGLTVASFPIISFYDGDIFEGTVIFAPFFIYAAIIILSGLMVSNLPIISLKFKEYTLKANMDKLLLVIITLLAAVFLKWTAVPVVFVAYVIVSLIFKPNKEKI